jgi:hypothetical protein
LVPVAVKVTGVPRQHGLHEDIMETETGNTGLTVMVTEFDVAGFPVAQVRSEVSWQVTTSAFAGVYVYAGLFVPAFTPLTFHWYTGLFPPFTGVTVKVTIVPWHIVLEEVAIAILTGKLLLEIIVIGLERAGFPVTQERLEIMEHVIKSPSKGT